MLSAGDTYLLETNLDADGNVMMHLHIIVVDVNPTDNATIVVNCESYTSPKQDDTVIFKQGDHEFIDRDTYVNYRRASIESIEDIMAQFDSRKAKKRSPLTPEQLDEVQRGLLKSPHTNFGVRNRYEEIIYGKIK